MFYIMGMGFFVIILLRTFASLIPPGSPNGAVQRAIALFHHWRQVLTIVLASWDHPK
jgi:hypothetical protein